MTLQKLKNSLEGLALIALIASCQTNEKSGAWAPNFWVVNEGSLHRESVAMSCNDTSTSGYLCMNPTDVKHLLKQCQESQEPWYKFW